MKTVGELLRSGRLSKGYTLEKLSDITKIDVAYITALEENQFKKLPSSTFAKGFIRNLAKALDKNPDELVAVFRRDFNENHGLPTKIKSHRRFTPAMLFHSQLTLIIIGIVAFSVYLIFQYRAVITPPPLIVESPKDGAVLISPVNITGHTTPGSVVTINEDLKAIPDNNGNFSTKLNLSPGQSEIKIESKNRFSRSTTVKIDITILSQ